jgi:hypothetical protein
VVLCAAIAFTAVVGAFVARDAEKAEADSCNLTLCTASHWGYSMTAIFLVDGFPVSANWNFTSQTTFWAYAQNPTTAVNSHAHEVWTSNWWPSGTWSVAQSTYTQDGSGGPLATFLGIGFDYHPQFDIWTSTWYSPNVWTLLTAIEHTTAGLWPADGAGGSYNNTRNECKKLTPTGAVGC